MIICFVHFFRFVNMLVQHFGNLSVSMVTNNRDSDYPLLVVVSKSKSAAEICLVLQGKFIGYEIFCKL